LLKFEGFIHKYRLNFNSSFIRINSPYGSFSHQWSRIERVILTKDFLFLYIKERNGYIISISNKCTNKRKIEELLTFVEKNGTHILKV
ncbi:YcxB family protein, partial [Flavobacterium sp. YO12]|uniref:YcxB family protein n=1 Tax=Flavobacterium sp. YO12 TaxID=1920029 RepID=UPI0010287B8A